MGGVLRGSSGRRWAATGAMAAGARAARAVAAGVVTAAMLMLPGVASAEEAGVSPSGPSDVGHTLAQAQAGIQALAAFQPIKAGAEPPAAVAAAKAYAVLQTACARCHQADRTDRPAPAANLGHILDLDALAREPGLVRPGLPDASRLYTLMLDRHLPLDVLSSAHADDLAPIDIEAVRDWIEQLPVGTGTCPDRQPLDRFELDGLMSGWLDQAGPDAKQTRFISLAHLYNACASDQELTAWREAVSKLLNSLSWAPLPARVETIGDKLALLAVNIGGLGWVPAHWDRLAAREPMGGAPAASEAVKATAATAHPVVRADWLASAASRPPLSHDLLGLPKRLSEMGRLLGADTAHDHAAPWLSRIVVETSAETARPRVIERQVIANGSLWMAHDLPAGTLLADLQGQPGRPVVAALARRLMFNLPNGMLAFAMFGADGGRSEAMPATPGGGSASTCFSCHTSGLTLPKPQATGSGAPAAGSAEKVGDALAKPLDDDKFRYRRALVQAGVDPDRTLGGLEIITSLARRYEMPVDLVRAAGETGTSTEELSQRLLAVEGEARIAARRLLQGTLPRGEFEILLAALAGSAKPAITTTATLADKPPAGIDLVLWSDEPRHRAGDLVSFNVRASAPCNLTLVSIDKAGRATVLFPSELDPDNAIAANQMVRIPRESAPYQLRMSTPGTETAVALCHPTSRLPEGVVPDYERQRFTVLGSWRNFLRGDTTPAGEDAKAPERTRPARARRGRGNGSGKVDAKVEPPPAPSLEPTARTAISVVVE